MSLGRARAYLTLMRPAKFVQVFVTPVTEGTLSVDLLGHYAKLYAALAPVCAKMARFHVTD